jgi:signal peptidase I
MNSSDQFVPHQPVPNQPIASPNGPVAPPHVPVDLPGDGGPLVSTELPVSSATGVVASPEIAAPAPQRRIVATPAADMVGSIQSLMGTVVIAIFVITFIVQAFQIPSESMENTLLVGDYLLVNKLCYGQGLGGRGLGDTLMPYQKIARGDIIVFHYPVDPQQHFVKRVIGVPGDHLRMVSKRVLINGKPLDEPYVRFLEPRNNLFRDDFPRMDIAAQRLEGDWWLEMRKLVVDGQLIIPEGHYFVMGDNRDNSDDSRYWGFVPQENIIGRPLVIYWSVRDWDRNPSASITGRLYHLAYAVTHIFQITRWNRTLRLVH